MTRAAELADRLLDFTESQLAALARGPLPGFRLPGMLLGHEVGPDVRADLVFTLGLMDACGRSAIAGVQVTEAIRELLAGVDGERTHTFYSYRVAETLALFGRFEGNPLLDGLDAEQRDRIALATDSSGWIGALDKGFLPRNYAAVLARCEVAREALGIAGGEGGSHLGDLMGRARALLGGYLDDSNSGVGRYDMYTVDVYLFCAPMAEVLGDPWRAGAGTILDLVDRTATRDGAAIAWGRSTGALGVCHTIELGGLACRHGLVDDPARWLARAASASRYLPSWYRDGWTTSHQQRSSDPYRGLDRRLQMSLDCLGKLADTARALASTPDAEFREEEHALFPDRDEVVWFDAERRAGVWCYRDRANAFTLPLVGPTSTDYLAVPRNPGLFEHPVAGELATMTPVVLAGGKRHVGSGLPVWAEHGNGRLHARYEGFPEAGLLEEASGGSIVAATRDVSWRVENRALRVVEDLTFAEPPDALSLQITEAHDRPLAVTFTCDGSHDAGSTEVDGIAEYRSRWSELSRVHHIDVQPVRRVHLEWSVTPVLRVVSTGAGHPYNDSLYAPLTGRVRVGALPIEAGFDMGKLAALAARTDVFHLHWPEWLLIGDASAHGRFITTLRETGVHIAMTQHNLVPHSKDPALRPVYALWAGAAELVLHHSAWGRERAMAAYGYRPDAHHAIIPHGHFGGAAADRAPGVREEVEHELGLQAGRIRLGIVGAPRAEKNVELAMRAVCRSGRRDIELVVLSLSGAESVPHDPRIVAKPYEMVPREVYDRRLAALDALLMPFDPEGDMLTTGTVGDAIGAGLPTITSSWPYAVEALGPAAIVYGSSEDALVRCLNGLGREDLDHCAAEARALQPKHDWSAVAELLYAELDRLGGTRL